MDFKVAGTKDVVTALQLDTKIDGLPLDVLTKALLQAKDARLAILEVMAGAIAEPRQEVASSAPKIISFEIPMDKIGEVIRSQGQGDQRPATGDRCGLSPSTTMGMVGTVTIGAKDAAPQWRKAAPADLYDPRPAAGRSGCHLPGARWSTSPSVGASSHPSRSGRPASHLEDRQGKRGRNGSRTCSSWDSQSR